MRLIPRFSVRTLFVVVTIIGLCAGWVTHQLKWIQDRHAFAAAHDIGLLCSSPEIPPPWHLRLFGERGYEHQAFMVEEGYLEQAKELFPEIERFEVVRSFPYD